MPFVDENPDLFLGCLSFDASFQAQILIGGATRTALSRMTSAGIWPRQSATKPSGLFTSLEVVAFSGVSKACQTTT